jgi:hypothetical protein
MGNCAWFVLAYLFPSLGVGGWVGVVCVPWGLEFLVDGRVVVVVVASWVNCLGGDKYRNTVGYICVDK